MKLSFRLPIFDGAAVELGLIPIQATSGPQAITGVSFTNSQTFGSGTITTTYDITGASFTNSQTFGSGVVSQSGVTQEITGTSFTNSQTFGAGTVSLDSEESEELEPRNSNDDSGYQPKWIKPDRPTDPGTALGATQPEATKKDEQPKPVSKPTLPPLSLATLSASAAKKIGEIQGFISSPELVEALAPIDLDLVKAQQEKIRKEIERRASLRQKQADFAQAEQEYEAIKAKRQAESDEEEEFALMYMMLDAQD